MLTCETRGDALARVGRALADPHLAVALQELATVVLAADATQPCVDPDAVDRPAAAPLAGAAGR